MRVDTAPFTDKARPSGARLHARSPGHHQEPVQRQGGHRQRQRLLPRCIRWPPRTSRSAPRTSPRPSQLLAAAGMPNGVTMNLKVEEFEEVPQYATLLQAMPSRPASTSSSTRSRSPTTTAQARTSPGSRRRWASPTGRSAACPRSTSCRCTRRRASGTRRTSRTRNFDTLAGQYDTTLDEAEPPDYAKQMVQIMVDETPSSSATGSASTGP